MILVSQGVVTASVTAQQQLWTEIRARSGGTGKPASGSSLCGDFATQVCEKCNQHSSICWCTHPDALADTMKARGVVVSRVRQPNEHALTLRIVNSIDHAKSTGTGVAPIVLVNRATHWVVVYGFVFDPSGNTGVTVGPFNVTEFLIHDPDLPAQKNHCVTDDWFSDYLRDIPCGTFAGKQVMVGT